MVIDHLGMVFYPEIDVLRVVGRLALPLFAYLVAEGTHRTSNREAYLSRLFALFVCSQFPYGLLVGDKLNIFLPLVVGGLATSYMIERKQLWSIGLLIAYVGFAHVQDISYGYIGPALVLVFAAGRPHLVVSSLVVAAIYFGHAELAGSHLSQMAVFVAPLVPVVVRWVHWRSPSRWRWAYWVYPVNLALFYLIAWQVGLTEGP